MRHCLVAWRIIWELKFFPFEVYIDGLSFQDVLDFFEGIYNLSIAFLKLTLDKNLEVMIPTVI